MTFDKKELEKIKLVVSDMDGTLLNSDHQVSNRFFELFHELKKRDIRFIAASGRQYNSIVGKLNSIKNDIIIIAENGGYVVEKEKEILSTPLVQTIRNKILNTLENIEDGHAVLCGKRNAYITGSSDSFQEMLSQYYSAYEIVENLHHVEADILKIAVYHNVDSETHIYPHVKQYKNELKVKVSGQNWVDLSAPDAHKGYALAKVQHLLNITPEETMVFGDYNNDIEMMQQAHFSIAMANAHPNVLKTARFKTLSNNENGVEYILEQLLQ
jgi:Cof subfamily protein (haloacid dehalogenase superfamily)